MIDENKSQHRNTIIESHLDCGNLQYAVERPHSNLSSVCYFMFEHYILGDVHFIIVIECKYSAPDKITLYKTYCVAAKSYRH